MVLFPILGASFYPIFRNFPCRGGPKLEKRSPDLKRDHPGYCLEPVESERQGYHNPSRRTLGLAWNRMRGSLPSALSSLCRLTSVSLMNNRLGGLQLRCALPCGRKFSHTLGTEKYLLPPPREQEKRQTLAETGSIHPYGRYGHAVKTRKTISTIPILWPVKAIFEKRAATVVDTLIHDSFGGARIPLGTKT